jgi:hypothetical protein
VILSDDPTAVDPETLAEIQVLVTLKENEVVYAADQKRQAARSRTSPIANDPEFGHHLVDALFSATRSQ